MLVGAAIGIPGGILIARVGVMRAYMWAWVCMALLAIAPIVPNFYVLLFLRLAYGVGLALMVVATGPLVMHGSKPREMLIVNSLNTRHSEWWCGGLSGRRCSAGRVAGLEDDPYGILRSRDRGDYPVAHGSKDRGTGIEKRTGISVREVFSVLRGRAVVLLVAADAGIFIQYTALTTWLPTFYGEERGISAQEAGL